VHVSVSLTIAHPLIVAIKINMLMLIVAIKIAIDFIGSSFDTTPRQTGSYSDW
jgi:hypothetical protein